MIIINRWWSFLPVWYKVVATKRSNNEPKWEQMWKVWQGHVYRLIHLFETNEPHVAVRRAKKMQERVAELEQVLERFVNIARADNYGNALSRLEAVMNSPHQIALAKLPKELCRPATIWMIGIPAKHGHPGMPPQTPTSAQRTYRLMLPWIVEAWQLAINDGERGERAKAEMLEYYETLSPQDFERKCYEYINDVDLTSQTLPLKNTVDKEPTVSELTALLKLTTPYTYEKQQRNSRE